MATANTSPRIDPFFYRQPEKGFVEELKKPLHESKPFSFGTRQRENGELDLSGMFLQIDFEDAQGLLNTAYADFRQFLTVCGMAGNRYPLHICRQNTSCFEEYTLTVTPEGAALSAGDTEGIRRGLVYLEDLLTRSEGPFLESISVTRRPRIKSRITRGFFSPTNRPPHNVDELWDDIDYYPDNYLNRLAHDGNNGIWIYTHFKDLIPSDILPDYGEGSERRIEKLRKVITKCARYGIKVYVFAVEPAWLAEEQYEQFPDLRGAPQWDKHCFCTRSERGADYCIEATRWLFTTLPELGGYIDITAGERVTNCSGSISHHRCPRCGRYTRGQTLAHTANLIKEGMRQAGAKGEFISWTYGHLHWEIGDVLDYVSNAPDDIKLMQNFDDYGFPEQLGKPRFAMDYWLSYVGPSYLFEETAKRANALGKTLYAKMQVCCSHELATVPYIPAPALVFRKYAGAYRYGVEGILQCWYFGNYPSIMSKAAGELSFMEDFSDEAGFLEYLAGILYGRSNAKAVAAAWECFSQGYENYPVNVMFSYYGPMHDGVIWKLQLLPKNRPLSRSWLLMDVPDGDRLGDAMQQAHTLEETLTLCRRMREKWQAGLALLPKEAVGEQATLAEALGVLFDSGCNILRFYQLREQLGLQKGDSREILSEMQAIVEKEMENSRLMAELCKKDNRLGYHSEAEGFKFFPEKLEDRIAYLQTLLKTEFPEVEARIREGKAPLGYYEAENEAAYPICRETEKAPWEAVGENRFRVSFDDEYVYLDVACPKDAEILFRFEGRLFHPVWELWVKEGKLTLDVNTVLYCPLPRETRHKEYDHYTLTETADGYRITASRRHIQWTEDERPFKLLLKIGEVCWHPEEVPVYNLGQGTTSAGEYGWLKYTGV